MTTDTDVFKPPLGKTMAQITGGAEAPLNHGDIGYIDGYVRVGNSIPCAVFVNESGLIGLVSPVALTAILD